MRATLAETRAIHAADERRVAAKLPDTAGHLNADLAGWLTPRRVTDALRRLRADGRVDATEAKLPTYSLTDAGRAWLAEPVARVSVPEVPEDATPSTGLVCGRRGITLTVAQCAAGWAARDGQDACSRGAEGPCRAGCPAGAKSRAVVEAAGERGAAEKARRRAA